MFRSQTPLESLLDSIENQEWIRTKIVLMAHPSYGLLPLHPQKHSHRSGLYWYLEKNAKAQVYESGWSEHFFKVCQEVKPLPVVLALSVRSIYERYLTHFERVNQIRVSLPNGNAILSEYKKEWEEKYTRHAAKVLEHVDCASWPEITELIEDSSDTLLRLKKERLVCSYTCSLVESHLPFARRNTYARSLSGALLAHEFFERAISRALKDNIEALLIKEAGSVQGEVGSDTMSKRASSVRI